MSDNWCVYELKQRDVAQELVLPWPESSIFLLLYIWKSSKENIEHGEINQQEINLTKLGIRRVKRCAYICIYTWRWLLTWPMLSPFTSINWRTSFGVAPIYTHNTSMHEKWTEITRETEKSGHRRCMVAYGLGRRACRRRGGSRGGAPASSGGGGSWSGRRGAPRTARRRRPSYRCPRRLHPAPPCCYCLSSRHDDRREARRRRHQHHPPRRPRPGRWIAAADDLQSSHRSLCYLPPCARDRWTMNKKLVA